VFDDDHLEHTIDAMTAAQDGDHPNRRRAAGMG
jgi:hypothetical protein